MRNFLLGAACLLAVAASPMAQAVAGPAWTFDRPGNSFSNGDWNFTNNFTVLNSITVTGLGYYADPFSGAVDDNPVSLFRCDTAGCGTTGTLLATATVTNAYPITNLFRFVTIPALTLLPGDYQIAGLSRGDNYTWNDVNFTTDPNIVYGGNSWQLASGATAPAFLNFLQNNVADGYWGPNFFIGTPTFAVPEPASLGLLGVGILGLMAARRRRVAAT